MAKNNVEVNQNKVPSSYVMVHNGANTVIVNVYGTQVHYGMYPTNSRQVRTIQERAYQAKLDGNKNYMSEYTVNEGDAFTLLIPTKADPNTPFISQLPTNDGSTHYPLYGNFFKLEAATMEIAGHDQLVYSATQGYSSPAPLQDGKVDMYCVSGPDPDKVADVANSITSPSLILGSDPVQ